MAETKTTIRLSKTDQFNVRIVAKTYSTTTVGAIRIALAETARRLLVKEGAA